LFDWASSQKNDKRSLKKQIFPELTWNFENFKRKFFVLWEKIKYTFRFGRLNSSSPRLWSLLAPLIKHFVLECLFIVKSLWKERRVK
jgi:hypothetical protein